MKNFRRAFQMSIFALLSTSAASITSGVNASSLATPHEMLQSQVEAFVLSSVKASNPSYSDESDRQLRVEVFAIDDRVKVPQCGTGYTFAMPDKGIKQSYASIKVSCEDTQWFLYVNAKIEQLQQVVVTADMLSPNTILTQQNLSLADIKTSSLRRTTFANISDLIGARIKYRVRPGQPINPNMVCFVCKGDLITLSAQANDLSISTKAVAQEDGNIGDTIQVKNSRSNKVVFARVANADTAVIGI